MPSALITGITGQDGAYLARLLVNKGYTVYGLVRRTSSRHLDNLAYLGVDKDVQYITGDVTDYPSLAQAMRTACPDEVYNLAAQSFVHASFDCPVSTFEINANGALNVLEAVRKEKSDARVYQASTSEMFGLVNVESQDEHTPFYPRSPYAVAKSAAHYAVGNYRDAYGLHASCGILFNHESPIRGKEFVTRKITSGIADILAGNATQLALGNLEAKRDWGHAEDYVEAMWLMLQQDAPDDYVIATGETHTVQDFVEFAFAYAGLDYEDYVVQDERFMRPSDVPLLCGNPAKAKERLGWEPYYTFNTLVHQMVTADLERSQIKIVKNSVRREA